MSGNRYFDGEGCQGRNQAAVIIVTLSLGPWEDTLGGSSWFPSVPASKQSACLFSCCLLIPPKQRCCSPSPCPHHYLLSSPCCNSPLLAISPFLFSLRYIIFLFVPGKMLIAIVTVQHLFHFSYHKCHSSTVNTRSATTLLWIYFSSIFGDIPHLKRRNTENKYLILYVCMSGRSASWMAEAMQVYWHAALVSFTQ